MGYFQMTRNVESIFGAVVTAPHQIPYTYTATGGEKFISLPFYPVTGIVTINGGMQVPLDNFEIDGNTLNLGRALSKGDVVFCLFDKILSPEDYKTGIRIYKFQAIGGETEFTPDYTSYGVQSLYIGGEYKTPEIEYSYDSTTGKVSLQTALTAGVWVVAEMSVKQPNISPLFDRSIQEIARSANVKDSEVILSTDTTQSLNGKNVIYSVSEQKAYGLPALPSNIYINSVSNGQLTYSPGNITVDLVPVPNSGVALRADLVSEDLELGDNLLTVKQPFTGSVVRTQHSKNTDFVSVKDFGAKGDGVTDDTAAIQAALDSGKTVYIPEGIYICTQELEVTTQGQYIYGAGRGYGYNSNTVELQGTSIVPKYSAAIFNWQHCSTIKFTGTGTPRIRTRVNYRGSAADPQDDPMSVCLNIQAEGVILNQFALFLDIAAPAPANELSDSIDNLGADWDVGVFIGCRCNTHLQNLAVIGYHRMANIWYDVTNAVNLPRFNSYRTGLMYPQGPVENGADGCSLSNVFTSGGLWGVNVQGPKLEAGQSSQVNPYYDALLGGLATDDSRGSWGFSDFLMENCQIFGANHHTRRRLVDMKASPDPINDWDVGGAYSISGFTRNASNALHGHRYLSCRFQSWAPFTVRLDRTARDDFFGCMLENPNFAVVKSRDGAPLTLSPATAFYGLCATANTKFLSVVSSQAPTTTAYTVWQEGWSQWANNSQAVPITRTPYPRLEVCSQDSTDTSVLRLGTVGNPAAATVYRATTGSLVSTSAGAFVWQDSTGNIKFNVVQSGNALFYGNAYPATDATRALGLAANRWTTVYAVTATINTSDGRTKTEVVEQSDAERAVALKLKSLIRRYRLKDSIEEKGEGGARYHYGIIAQDVVAAFAEHGLDAHDYGLLCLDQWDDQYEEVMHEVVGSDGVSTWEPSGEMRLVKEAGERYGIRYEELLCFIIAAI